MRQGLLQKWATILALCMAASPAWAHSGGLNAQGCHNGSEPYHCHNGSSDGGDGGWIGLLIGIAVVGGLIAYLTWPRSGSSSSRYQPDTVYTPDPEPVGGESCAADDDCERGFSCASGACRKDCTREQDCAEGLCVERRCLPTVGRACTTIDECGQATGCGGGICARECGDDAECDDVLKCLDGLCRQPVDTRPSVRVGPTPMGFGFSW